MCNTFRSKSSILMYEKPTKFIGTFSAGFSLCTMALRATTGHYPGTRQLFMIERAPAVSRSPHRGRFKTNVVNLAVLHCSGR